MLKLSHLGRALGTAVAALFVLTMLTVTGFAQTETGQITVKATDPQGAAVPGAAVLVKSVGTGREVTGTTDTEGTAVVTNLQPGIYDVTVTANGFAPRTQRAQVTVGGKISVEAALAVGAISGESVTIVAGGGVEVNTQTQELSNVVSSQQIRELPSLTRNPYDFVATAANVSDADTSNRGTGFAINGQRSSSTNILLDGGENVNTFTASVGQSVPLDSVQEFRVITSNFSAEYGRAAGGIVNVATRAGTNEYHGTLYEFNRVSRLASNYFQNNAQGLPKDLFTRNQFGYSFGGRLIRDKLFFFSSTEWTRVRSTGNVINYIPTPQLIAASAASTRSFFNAYGGGATCNGTTLSVAQVVGGRNIGSGAFSSLPGTLPAFCQVRYTVPRDVGAGSPQNSYQTVERIDYNLSNNTQLYGRYALESQNFFPGTVSSSPYANYNTGETDFNQNMLLNLTHSFSSKLISQTKLTYNRLNQSQPLTSAGDVPTLYFFGSTAASFSGFRVALPGFLPFSPGSGVPFGGPQNVGQVNEDLNWTRGKHTLRFGGNYVYIQDNRLFGAYETASETLGQSYTQALNNFVTGNLLQFQAAINPQGHVPGERITLPAGPPAFTRSNRYNEYATYFNDTWRVNQRFTANLGVRYEYYGTQHNKNRALDSNFFFGDRPLYDYVRAGQITELATAIRNGQVRVTDKLWEPDKNNFAPRLGFAWDIFGDGRTSLRGGYGVAYERNFGNVTFNVIQNPPGYAVVSINPSDVGGTIPVSVSNFGPLSGTGSVVLPISSLRAVDPHIKNAYSHFWSASFEREVMAGTVATVEWSGSAGRDLYSISNINRVGTGLQYLHSSAARPALIGGTTPRLNGQFSNINFRANGGRSNYNALIATLDSNNFRNQGLTFTARYTYSVARDNLSSTFSETAQTFNLGFTDPFNPDLDYGYADFDIRHRFAGSFNYSPTFLNHFKGVEGQVLGGWTLTGIVQARTGSPFTVFDCTNATFTTCIRLVPTGPLATRSAGTNFPAADTPNRFVLIDLSGQQPSTFTDIANGTEVGPFPANMSRRNAFRGPGLWNVDAGLYKNFRITEGTSLQFRGEFYNLFNHANLAPIYGEAEVNTCASADPDTGDCLVRGVPGMKSGRRNVQLAVKFIF